MLHTILVAVYFVGATAPAFADQYFDYGLKLFQQRNFTGAANYLDIRLKTMPTDAYALYYRALCYQYSGDLTKAKELYQTIMAGGADAKIKELAKVSYEKIEAYTKAHAGPASGASSGTASAVSKTLPKGQASAPIPKQGDDDDDDEDGPPKPTIVPLNARAYFTQSAGHDDIVVDGSINKRRLAFCFDTGASVTLVGKNHLASLGIHPPTTPATGQVGGIGGTIDTWTMKMDVSIGGITKRIPVRIAEHWDHAPLLGQDFFSDVDYEIDNKGHCINFRKSEPLSAKDDMYSIPFSRRGKHLCVDVEGDKGRKTTMIVDTGAESVSLSPTNVKDLGIDTEGGTPELHSGVGGTTKALGLYVDVLRLGPIIMRNIKVSADIGEKGFVGAGSNPGLLGQAFFGSWRFTVDNKNQRLRFFH